MSEAASANFPLLVSRSAARETFRTAIRLYVGRGKRFSVKQASNGSGVADRMIESFMADPESADYRKPDLEEILSLASFLGSHFTCEWLSLAHQGAYQLPDTDELPPGRIAADSAGDTAEIAARAADGRFCDEDKAALPEVGARMMSNGAKLVAIAGRRT